MQPLLLQLILSIAVGATSEPDSTGALRVWLIDRTTGIPVSGLVTLVGTSWGCFSGYDDLAVCMEGIAPGLYRIECRSPGYLLAYEDISIEAGAIAEIQAMMDWDPLSPAASWSWDNSSTGDEHYRQMLLFWESNDRQPDTISADAEELALLRLSDTIGHDASSSDEYFLKTFSQGFQGLDEYWLWNGRLEVRWTQNGPDDGLQTALDLQIRRAGLEYYGFGPWSDWISIPCDSLFRLAIDSAYAMQIRFRLHSDEARYAPAIRQLGLARNFIQHDAEDAETE